MKKPCPSALLVLLLVLLSGCSTSNGNENDRLKIITIHSDVLGKDMVSQVYLPSRYDDETRYPVLYFLPSNGGSSYTVINQFGITECADRLVNESRIEPMIIVALGIDNSFGMDTGIVAEKVITSTDKAFDKGLYESYIVNEAIPYMDAHFNTIAARERRYIGGYSMGGFAALHVAFRNAELFGKVGGHSPTVFVDDFPDSTVKEFMYPTESLRRERDPIYLAGQKDISGLSVYLDTGITDVNAAGLEALTDALQAGGANPELHFFDGTHGFSYCMQYMEEYLLFYGGR